MNFVIEQQLTFYPLGRKDVED